MATAKRLSSGSYRVRVYSHTDSNGRKVYESFTAPTKREAEMMAAEWANKKDRRKRYDMTVGEAIAGYIAAKEGVLSPSTIREYKRMCECRYDDIKDKHIKKLTTEDVQIYISDLSKSVGGKSVKNAYGLLRAAVGFYEPDIQFKVNLPKTIKKRPVSPSDENVGLLFEAANPELKKCIALAAFGSLRRGEICALKYSDISGNQIYVHADVIYNDKKEWEYKEFPKTDESVRTTVLPWEIIELLGQGNPDDFVIRYTPDGITTMFTKLRNKHGLNNIRFHDLRHYYASIGVILNIPDIYLAGMGGWSKNGGVMKSVYQNQIESISDIYARKMTDHFKGIIKKSMP